MKCFPLYFEASVEFIDIFFLQKIWNQKRPPWLEAILHLIYPVLDPVIHMLIVAVQTGASMYQVFLIIKTYFCLIELYSILRKRRREAE